ncbi:MAG TPA: TIR domain-containing protein [Gaiellaceae bacterium]|nr:TIR domain-containing protein [Gaiellaceae bacterium]
MSATAEQKNGKPPDGVAATSVKGHPRPSTQYPKHTLEEALAVPRAIENNNAGQPLPPTETAIAMGISPGSSRLQTLLSASLRYGLSTGNYKSDKIVLSDLANEIVTPVSEEQAAAALVKAALLPPTFKATYDHFKGKKLPEGDFYANTFVREFGVPKEDAKRCAEIFRANLEYAGLLKKASTGVWVSTEIPTTLATEVDSEVDVAEGDGAESSLGTTAPKVPPALVPPSAPASLATPARPKAIFIGHGPNNVPLTQLTKILDEYGLPYKVAEYEPSAGRPISQKVADLMGECGAAILIFTADRELRDLEGNPVWMSSGNVAHELGAASVMYDGRVVIFKELGVDLASNFSGIGYIEFEKDKLSAHGIELFRELVHFKLVKISVGE